MKKYIIACVLGLVFSGSYAKTVQESELNVLAARFLNGVCGKTWQATDLEPVYKGRSLTIAGVTEPVLLVYRVSGANGWVVMAGDDVAKPVLAYSDNSEFDETLSDPAMRMWLGHYCDEIAYLKQHNATPTADVTAAWEQIRGANSGPVLKPTSGVGPLLSTTWNQSPYYNFMCPFDTATAQFAVTGCVATALAQVMKFWNWPTRGCGMHTYIDTPFGVQTADFGATAYDWAGMPNAIFFFNNAIETLMYQAGVSVDMFYGVDGSGAFVNTLQSFETPCTEYALKSNFHYKKSLYSIYRDGVLPGYSPGTGPDSINETSWISQLKAELDLGHPIIYCGYQSIQEGHSWVCDGYNSTGLFHFNWGWGGTDNGYFTVDEMALELNLYQTAIMGIEPDSFPSDANVIQMAAAIKTSNSPTSFGQPFSVSTQIMNTDGTTFNGDVAAWVFDSSNTLVGKMPMVTGISLGTRDTSDVLNFATSGMYQLVSGIYSIRFYCNDTVAMTGWNPIANNGTYINFTTMAIYNDSDIELASPVMVTTGMMTDHDSVAVTTSMTNVSYSNAGNPSFWSHHNFNGNVRATLNNVADGSLAFVILELDGVQVDTNTFQSLTFANHDLEIAPGTYLLEIQEQYNGTGNYYLTGSTYEQNPVLVQVAVNSGVKAISK